MHGIQETGDKVLHACPICFKTFTIKYNMERHIRTHTNERPYSCQRCSEFFFRPDALSTHERKAHPTEVFSFKCDECHEVFLSRALLRVHGKKHKGAHECEVCGRVFSLKTVMVRHKAVHSQEKQFQCRLCSKAYYTSDGLRLHSMKHTGEKPFHCSMCNKDFEQRSQLNGHNKRIHTDNGKIHKCIICHKLLSNSFELKKHQEVHVGKGLCNCQICSKVFSSEYKLRTHKKLHMQDKTYSCEICGKKFGALRYLRAHKSRDCSRKV